MRLNSSTYLVSVSRKHEVVMEKRSFSKLSWI